MKVSETIKSLREKINNHNYQYYVLDNPIISDSDYDNVKKHTTGIVDDFGTSIKTFNGATNVDSNVISITGHGFTTGTPVVYKSGATVVTNLTW